MELLFLVVLLVFSGIFSGSETALVALSMARAEALLNEGRAGAKALYQLKKDPSRMLTTILIGNNLVNIAASALATVMATRQFGSAGPGIAVGVLTLFILVFGEITPKSLATRYSERISLFIANPLLLFMRLIYPLVWFFSRFAAWVYRLTGGKSDPTITESELIGMLGYGVREGEIEHNERKIIERVFAFNDLKVRDVMTPKGGIFSLDGTLSVNDAIPIVARERYSRIPVYEGQKDNFTRVLYLRDLLRASASGHTQDQLQTIAHEPLFVSQYQAIDDLFARLRRRNQLFSIVVDEYGDVRGIVTLEDLLEELVGEIYDESDVAPADVDSVSSDEISVQGAAEMRVVADFFGLELLGKPTDTVSLWILNHTECIPHDNEIFTIDNLEVRIVKASDRSIDQVNIRYPATAAAD
ncbi:MAG: hemolysin family protein [Gammaproteobacteria bacterium]|jgi:CBS domain containing-hemolysin-like protein|nr:hemolysin family protein [Gammaproteobacteria bacterium]MDH3887412.1 hemolysin family protein [Gammaproteobacteria bacterium]MDH3986146.1 hemolysin family protein [Gammaproteobacteria bacterium]